MLQFLQPLWLSTAAAVVVPVLIHLWNIRQGKTLKVGSISLLLQSNRQRTRSFRIRDWLLLLLRCAMIVLLAVLLAGPVWKQDRTTDRTKGWVVLEKSAGLETTKRFSGRIDSLLQAGMELHLLEPGFPRIDRAALLSPQSQTNENDLESYWTLLLMLQRETGSKLPVYLFTSDRLTRFNGKQPELALNLHWQTFTPADSTRRWLASARLMGSDSLQLLTATSTPSSLQYSQSAIAATRPAASGYSIQFVAGRMMIQPADTGSLSGLTEVDTATLQVSIYSKETGNDARYLAAALDAIRAYTRRNIRIEKIEEPAVASSGDWLFWLSAGPVPTAQHYHNIFRYAPGKEISTQSWIEQAGQAGGSGKVGLYKTIPAPPETGGAELLWTDAFTQPLLTREAQRNMAVYTFFSHLDPQWNDLPWREEFPRWLLQLMMASTDTMAKKYDTRSINPVQALPVLRKTGTMSNDAQTATTALNKGIWLLIFALLCLERVLTFRQKTSSNT